MEMNKRTNTGAPFEERVYELISKIVSENKFMVAAPNVRIRRKPRYYSKDRDSEIEFDVSVEKYLVNLDENENVRPSIIVIIECKDYSNGIPVDDVEEFHAKLQQIGADNTKGMIITQNGCFQRSALAYADSKGIALARILPSEQIFYHFYYRGNRELTEKEMEKKNTRALIEKDYMSYDNSFFASTRDWSLVKLILRLIEIDYLDYLQFEYKFDEKSSNF